MQEYTKNVRCQIRELAGLLYERELNNLFVGNGTYDIFSGIFGKWVMGWRGHEVSHSFTKSTYFSDDLRTTHKSRKWRKKSLS